MPLRLKVAIFGGTFDPIHNAHLEVARKAMDHFALDEVLFVPAANPPHKSGVRREAYEHRYRMVELACQGEPRFVPSRIEEGNERSYSIVTVEKLQRLRSRDRFFFLIGADAFAEIRTWHRWPELLAKVDFVVVSRPGHQYDVPSGARVHRLETVSLDVSSSGIRAALAEGGTPAALPPSVAQYIVENRLYQREPEGALAHG